MSSDVKVLDDAEQIGRMNVLAFNLKVQRLEPQDGTVIRIIMRQQ